MPVKVKTKYGEMLMNILPRFEKEHANMEFEPGFLREVESGEYDIFVDVGAAWGYFAIPATYHCEYVLAYEPKNSRRKTLEQNIKAFGLTNIEVSSKAVGTGEKELYKNSKERGMVGPLGRGRSEKVEVDWITLSEIVDRFQGKKILIKVDVEGYELDVIASLKDKEKYRDITFLIERHEFPDVGYSEEELMKAMIPYIGRPLGKRKQTSHYLFIL